MKEPARILFVDDEQNVLHAVERMLLDEDYVIATASSGKEGLDFLEKNEVHVVVSDYRMPEMTGVEFLRIVARKWPDTVRIVLSGYSDTAAVVGAINEGGIYKYLSKPWNDDELRITIANAATLYFLQKRVGDLAGELQRKNEEIARLQEALAQAGRQREGG